MIAVVTGGARGIGAAVATRLAEDGHDIAVLDLEEGDCAGTVEAVLTLGRRACAVGADVSDEASVAGAYEQVRRDLGDPTILINNAGAIRDRTLKNMTLDEWNFVVDVNLRGTFLMCRAAAEFMRQAGWGRMVNISSVAALGHYGQANYSAAKAGIQGLTKTLSLELGRYGITVNAVAPGFIATAMTAAIAAKTGVDFDDMQVQAARTIAVRRVGLPIDVANAVAFFTDARSDFVSGQILYVGGGPFA